MELIILNENREVSIIPQPVRCEVTNDEFELLSNTAIIYSIEFQNLARYLYEMIVVPTGFDLALELLDKKENLNNAIILNKDKDLMNLGEEGYKIEVNKNIVQLSSFHAKGIFYAIQTLRQLLPVEIELKTRINFDWSIPGVKITDFPRFPWRGFMFDEGRHFHGKKVVKRMLDLMVLHKLNIFHWHLTEDQGWRIEIKKCPKLTEIGSRRSKSQIGGDRSFIKKKFDEKPHEGFYTQDEIKEIIEYAKKRFITIVPEFDVPGHSQAALAAYPEYSCTGGPFEVATTWGIKKDVFCLGKDSTFKFIQDIFTEIIQLFPSPYIHIGGDEAPTKRWEECPDCQKRLKEESFEEFKSIQHYFTKRITDFLIKKGKKPIGWNEILTEKVQDLDINVISQHWLRDDNKVLEHLRHGRKIIISRFFYYYLDYPYIMTPLRKTFEFEPVPAALEEEYHQNILGVEAPLWTEWVPNIDRIDWQVFPRLTAVAESGWTPKENKDYSSFRKRLKFFLRRLDLLGVKYAKESTVDPGKLKRFFTPLLMLRDPINNITR
ncbi:MAG: beta-N-acetylhexosaminidase [Candidatus Hodarchaeales archaeon]